MTEESKVILAQAMGVELEYINDNNLGDIYEYLSCLSEKHREVSHESRWWNEVEVVVEVNGIFLSYISAESTGDSTPTELGWERGSISDIIEVVPKVIETTIYVRK